MKRRLTAILLGSLTLALPLPAQPVNDELTSKSQERIDWEANIPKTRDENPAFRFVQDDPRLPRVLIIGDSISIGYTEPVRRRLAGKANVHRIPANGGHTGTGLERIEKWLGDKPWDVITFNWGLHDQTRLRDGEVDITAPNRHSHEVYERNLEELAKRLKKTGAKLVWVSTTPVPPDTKRRIPGEEIAYNQVAAQVMKRHGIPIVDLHTPAAAHLQEWQLPEGNVHFNDKGSESLGKLVAKGIEKVFQRDEGDE
ncbi:SGNH/GDSL hydrolase family protein [bacterium]|nr:SGNH/GDSL hydrolase family protein [bacterium]